MKPGFISLWLSLAFTANAQVTAAPGNIEHFNVGVSYASFGTVSHNDATAALKAWAMSVAAERHLNLNWSTRVYAHEEELRQALAAGEVDAATMAAEEFVDWDQRPEHVYLTAKSGCFTEEYALIVHRAAGVDGLAALKGQRLVCHSGPRMGPALPWLETVVAEHGLGSVQALFHDVASLDSPSKAILRVFFHQADACLVTTNAFSLACELNPQLVRELKVVAVSPPLIPTLFFFRPGYASVSRPILERAIVQLHTTAAGQQVLTVFQGSNMEKQPLSCFDATRQLLNTFHHLPVATAPAAAPTTTAALGNPALP